MANALRKVTLKNLLIDSIDYTYTNWDYFALRTPLQYIIDEGLEPVTLSIINELAVENSILIEEDLNTDPVDVIDMNNIQLTIGQYLDNLFTNNDVKIFRDSTYLYFVLLGRYNTLNQNNPVGAIREYFTRNSKNNIDGSLRLVYHTSDISVLELLELIELELFGFNNDLQDENTDCQNYQKFIYNNMNSYYGDYTLPGIQINRLT